jgi:hypothetical protein
MLMVAAPDIAAGTPLETWTVESAAKMRVFSEGKFFRLMIPQMAAASVASGSAGCSRSVARNVAS